MHELSHEFWIYRGETCVKTAPLDKRSMVAPSGSAGFTSVMQEHRAQSRPEMLPEWCAVRAIWDVDRRFVSVKRADAVAAGFPVFALLAFGANAVSRPFGIKPCFAQQA